MLIRILQVVLLFLALLSPGGDSAQAASRPTPWRAGRELETSTIEYRCSSDYVCQSFDTSTDEYTSDNQIDTCLNLCFGNTDGACDTASCFSPPLADQGYCTSNSTCTVFTASSWGTSTACFNHCPAYTDITAEADYLQCDTATCNQFPPAAGYFCDKADSMCTHFDGSAYSSTKVDSPSMCNNQKDNFVMDCLPSNCFSPSPSSTGNYCTGFGQCTKFWKHYDSDDGLAKWGDVKSENCWNRCLNYDADNIANYQGCDKSCTYYCTTDMFNVTSDISDQYWKNVSGEFNFMTQNEFIAYNDEAADKERCPVSSCNITDQNTLFGFYRASDSQFYFETALAYDGSIYEDTVKLQCTLGDEQVLSSNSFKIHLHDCYGDTNTDNVITEVYTKTIYEVVTGSSNDPDGAANTYIIGDKSTANADFWMTIANATACPLSECELLYLDGLEPYITLDPTNYYISINTAVSETIIHDLIKVQCKYGSALTYTKTTEEIEIIVTPCSTEEYLDTANVELSYPSTFSQTQCFGYPSSSYDYFEFDRVRLYYTDPSTSVKKECAVLYYFITLDASSYVYPGNSPDYLGYVTMQHTSWNDYDFLPDTDLTVQRARTMLDESYNQVVTFYLSFTGTSNAYPYWSSREVVQEYFYPELSLPFKMQRYALLSSRILDSSNHDLTSLLTGDTGYFYTFTWEATDFLEACTNLELDEVALCPIDSQCTSTACQNEKFEVGLCTDVDTSIYVYPSTTCSGSGTCRALDVKGDSVVTRNVQLMLRRQGASEWDFSPELSFTFLCGGQEISASQSSFEIEAIYKGTTFSDVLVSSFVDNVFSSDIASCQITSVGLFADSSLSTATDPTFVELVGTSPSSAKIRLHQDYAFTMTVYLAAKGDNQDMAKTAPVAIRAKVCGNEAVSVSEASSPYVLEFDGLQGTPILDGDGNELYRENYIDASIVQGFFSVSDSECEIDHYELMKNQEGESIDSSSGSEYISLESSSPSTGTKLIVKANVPATITYTLYIMARTMGKVDAFKEVQIRLVYVNVECLLGALQSTLGIPDSGTTVTTEETDNVINNIMQASNLYITTGNFAFVFPSYEVIYGGNTITKCIEQTFELQAFGRYDEIELPLSELGSAQESIFFLGSESAEPANLNLPTGSPTIDKFYWYYTDGTTLKEATTIEDMKADLDSSLRYNMAVLNISNYEILFGYYEMSIKVTQNIEDEGISDRLTSSIPTSTLSFQFYIDECRPTSITDISSDKIATSPSIEFSYFMNNGTELKESPFDDIFSMSPECGSQYYLQQSVDYTYKTEAERTEKVFQDLISFDFQPRIDDNTQNSTFSFKASSSDQLGYFDIKMLASFKSLWNPDRTWPELDVEFFFYLNASEVIFVQNSAPTFEVTETPMDTEWNATESSVPTEVVLPNIIELDNETETVSVEVSSSSVDDISRYVRYVEDGNKLVFSDMLNSLEKDLAFKVTLKDDNPTAPAYTSYDFTVKCVYCIVEEEEEEETEVPVVVVDESWLEEQKKLEEQKQQQEQEQETKIKIPPRVRVSSLKNTGEMTIKFTKSMKFPDSFQRRYEEDLGRDFTTGRRLQETATVDEVQALTQTDIGIKIEAEAATPGYEDKMGLSWYLIGLSSTKLKIQLVFENSKLISMTGQDAQDTLNVVFSKQLQTILVDQEQLLQVDFTDGEPVLVRALPAIMPLGAEADQLKTQLSTTQNGMQSIMATNFLLSPLISLSLNFLWGMINCVQIIVYLPLFSIVIPANLNMLMSALITIATFDVIPGIEEMQDQLFNFIYSTEDQLTHSGYLELGFETRNFVMNTGSLFFFSIFFLVKHSFELALRQVATYYPGWVGFYRYIKSEATFTSVAFRFLLEGYIEILMSGILSFELVAKADLMVISFSDFLAFAVGLFFFIVILFLPFQISRTLAQKIDYLERIQGQKESEEELYELLKAEKQHDQKWDVFYHGIKKVNNFDMHYYLVYVLRRMVFILNAYYMQDWIAFQVMFNIFVNIAYLMFIFHAQPFLQPNLNRLELFNEGVILVISYLILGFTDWVVNPNTKYHLGSIMVYLILFDIGANLSIIVFQVFKIGERSLRKRAYEKKLRSLRLEIMAKYSIREQHMILRSLRTKRPLEEIQKEEKDRRLRFQIRYLPHFEIKNFEDFDDILMP